MTDSLLSSLTKERNNILRALTLYPTVTPPPPLQELILEFFSKNFPILFSSPTSVGEPWVAQRVCEMAVVIGTCGIKNDKKG